MKEIKFRGKRLNNNEWVYGSLFLRRDRAYIIEGNTTKHGCSLSQEGHKLTLTYAYRIKPRTVGQYTGLKDKNGKEIYEGDILIHRYYQEKGVVIWHKAQTRFALEYFDKKTQELFPIDYKHLEVIGNIHGNPELLKKG